MAMYVVSQATTEPAQDTTPATAPADTRQADASPATADQTASTQPDQSTSTTPADTTSTPT